MIQRVWELASLFFRLGVFGFGGPAAHIAAIEHEVVERNGWLSHDEFLDMVGATNLIPGPNSTEMAMHVGYRRAGFVGLLVAGACFILPATAISMAAAAAYVAYGTTPQVAPILAGIQPAVAAIIAVAVWRLGRKAVKSSQLAVVGVAVLIAAFMTDNLVMVLLVGGLLGGILVRLGMQRDRGLVSVMVAFISLVLLRLFGSAPTIDATKVADTVTAGDVGAIPTEAVPLQSVALLFLKVGSVLYGGGYVLVAYLRSDVVERFGWLSESQLLDAIAIGQVTPGPILSTATVVGYVVAGASGAVVATCAIFAPSFVFVALLGPLLPRLRKSPWTAAFLDAVNVSALGIMAAVGLTLLAGSVTGWASVVVCGGVLLGAGYFQISAPKLIAAGGIVGWIVYGIW